MYLDEHQLVNATVITCIGYDNNHVCRSTCAYCVCISLIKLLQLNDENI